MNRNTCVCIEQKSFPIYDAFYYHAQDSGIMAPVENSKIQQLQDATNADGIANFPV